MCICTGTVVDGQFDDAIEPPDLPPVQGYSLPWNHRIDLVSPKVPMQVPVSVLVRRNQLHEFRPNFPTFYFTQPTLPQNLLLRPGQHQHQYQQTSFPFPPAVFKQQHQHQQQHYPMQNASPAGSTRHLPIAPRPSYQAYLMAAHKQPRSKASSSEKHTPLTPPRSRAKAKLQGAAAAAAAYGTKLMEKRIEEIKENKWLISPFHKIIQDHPSDLLLPFSDVVPKDRIRMVPYVECDETMQRPVYLKDLISSDVLLGRGGLSNNHIGNLWFRSLVASYRIGYTAAPKGGKGQLARNICNYVRVSGGRFLERRDNHDRSCHNRGTSADAACCWFECGDKRAQAKCSQALREFNGVSEEFVSEDGGKGKSSDKRSQPASTERDSSKTRVPRMRQIELSVESSESAAPPFDDTDASCETAKRPQEVVRATNQIRPHPWADETGELVAKNGNRRIFGGKRQGSNAGKRRRVCADS